MGKTKEGVVLCGALDVDYVEFAVWREIQVQVSNKLVSSSETNLVGKTERSHCKANKIRFSPRVFIIYLFIFGCAGSVAARAESKEELMSFLMKVKEESEKAGLKFNIQ